MELSSKVRTNTGKERKCKKPPVSLGGLRNKNETSIQYNPFDSLNNMKSLVDINFQRGFFINGASNEEKIVAKANKIFERKFDSMKELINFLPKNIAIEYKSGKVKFYKVHYDQYPYCDFMLRYIQERTNRYERYVMKRILSYLHSFMGYSIYENEYHPLEIIMEDDEFIIQNLIEDPNITSRRKAKEKTERLKKLATDRHRKVLLFLKYRYELHELIKILRKYISSRKKLIRKDIRMIVYHLIMFSKLKYTQNLNFEYYSHQYLEKIMIDDQFINEDESSGLMENAILYMWDYNNEDVKWYLEIEMYYTLESNANEWGLGNMFTFSEINNLNEFKSKTNISEEIKSLFEHIAYFVNQKL